MTRSSRGDLPPVPNFIVIGAMKSGTTSLYHYLRSHPHVFMPRIKELDFFVAELNWRRGFDWYQRQFARRSDDCVAVGEASTNYTKHPRYQGVPERMAKYIPTARLIYVVRDPIERMRSHYEHSVAIGLEREPIERALLENPAYLTYSRYAMQIQQYLDWFPADQLMVVTSEDLRYARHTVMRRIHEFLDVAIDYVPPNLDHEFYRTEDRATYSPLVASFRTFLKRHWPRSKQAKEVVDNLRLWRNRHLPLRRQEHVAKDAETPARRSTTIPDDLRSRLEASLADDVKQLYEYVTGDFKGWGIA